MGAKRLLLLAVTCLATGVLLSGCTDFKRELGLSPTAPDEFAVESRAPLTIPPDFDLRPPQPGAPRPQEASAEDKARKAIDNAGPGEPGKQVPPLQSPKTVASGQSNPDQEAADNFSNKLLGYQDTAGAAVDKRQTTVMKDVY